MAEALIHSVEQPIRLAVTEAVGISRASQQAKDLATALHFTSTDCEEIALVVSELASNLVRHAGGGTITIASCGESNPTGIEIESNDDGPGIPDVERAIGDGYSTAGSLGLGLGTVNRLMDDFEVHSQPGGGTHIVCRRRLRMNSRPHETTVVFGVASRSYRGLPENGDAFVIHQWNGMALAGVIDGLGHGQFAQKAAHTARQYVARHFDQKFEYLFRGVGRACRATRGVVMSVARFDCTHESVEISGIGNVDVRLFSSYERINVPLRRGVIGLNAPNPVLTHFPWRSGSVLVIHSDGVRSRWQPADFDGLWQQSASQIAQKLLQTLEKQDDDATVLVAKHTGL